MALLIPLLAREVPQFAAALPGYLAYRGTDGRWHARVTVGRRLDGERDRRHLSRATKPELDAAIRDLENARDSGQQPWLLDNVTVEDWLEHWLEEILPLSVRSKTRSGYASHLRVHVIPVIGAARLTELRPETFERLYRRLIEDGRSTHVAQGVHRVLRSSLNEAVRRQRLLTNPAALARPPRVEKTEIEPLTAQKCRAILRAPRGRLNAARWSVALSLGLRQGEALRLMWDDVDLDTGVLRVRRPVQRPTWSHGCGPRRRKEPACGHLRGAECPQRRDGGLGCWSSRRPARHDARWRCRRRWSPSCAPNRAAQLRLKLARANVWDHTHDLVFCTDWGTLIDPHADYRDWKNILRDAGVRQVRLHDARHTAATLVLLQGVHIRTVMAIMGWTELATAQRYVHAVDELRHEAARRMGATLWVTCRRLLPGRGACPEPADGSDAGGRTNPGTFPLRCSGRSAVAPVERGDQGSHRRHQRGDVAVVDASLVQALRQVLEVLGPLPSRPG